MTAQDRQVSRPHPGAKEAKASRPISRVLYGLRPEPETRQPFIWDACCQTPRATYPDTWPGNRPGPRNRFQSPRCPYSVLLPVGFTMPPLLPAARWALTPPFHPYPDARPGRFAFCGTFPEVAPAGRYPAPCFLGARTFLPRGLSALAAAAVRPTGVPGLMWVCLTGQATVKCRGSG